MSHKKAVAVSMLLTWLLSAGIVEVILMVPLWLQQQRGISASVALQANCVAIIALACGCIVAGVVIGRFGARKNFVVGCALLAVGSWIFYHSDVTHPPHLFLTYGTAGFFVGIMGGVPFVMVYAFPAPVRFSGISFSYNISYAIFGGLTPMVVTLLMKVTPMAPSWYVLALALMGVALGFALPGQVKGALPRTDRAKAVG